MNLLDQRLLTRKPSLHDGRGARHLLVWGDLAHWLVVDDELYALLKRFDGQRTVKRVLRDHAKRWRKPLGAVKRETERVIRQLLERGILNSERRPPAVDSEPARIANLTINLTNRCNLKCRWCYNAGRTSDEMAIEHLMDAVEKGAPIFDKTASFIILGGEPLLDSTRLLTALDRAGDLFGPAPMLSTNGTLLDERRVDDLARRRVEVQVSLDSHDRARHDAVRGKGVYDKALVGVRRLVDRGIHTILSMVYTRENSSELEDYLDLALQLGVQEARFIPMRLIGRGLEARSSCPDQFAVFDQFLDVLSRRAEFRPLLVRDFFSVLAIICRYSTRRTSCGVGRRVLFIDADGAVYPCPNHVQPEFQAGSLAETGLAGIFEESPVLKNLRARYVLTAYDRCQECSFRHWCAGDCRAEVLAVTGDPLAASPHCEELQRVYKELLWLLGTNDARLGTAPDRPDGKATAETFL